MMMMMMLEANPQAFVNTSIYPQRPLLARYTRWILQASIHKTSVEISGNQWSMEPQQGHHHHRPLTK